MVNSTDQQDARAQTVHQKTVCVDGQDFHVVYKAQGNNVEIVSASKGATSDVAADESQRDGQTKDAVQRSDISPDEMSKIQEKVKEEHKQENKTEAVGYKNVEEISDRIDCVTKVSKHVYGQKGNEFNDPSRGQPQNIHTMADYRQHAIDTMKDPATSCFVGQNGSDKNALFFYNKNTNTYLVVPQDSTASATMYRPNDSEQKFSEKHAKQVDAQGRLPEIKSGAYDLLPQLEKDQTKVLAIENKQTSGEVILAPQAALAEGQKQTAAVSNRTISADEYIKSPEAQKEYRVQAEERVKSYVSDLQQKGLPAEQVAKIEENLHKKLDNPVSAYALKEGLDLRDMRKEADQTSSIKVVRDYYAGREQASSDISRVKEAFGESVKERTPEQTQRISAETSWDRLGKERLADLRHNVETGVVKPEEKSGHEKRIKKSIEDAKTNDLTHSYDQARKETTEQQQSSGGGGGSSQRQTVRQYRYSNSLSLIV